MGCAPSAPQERAPAKKARAAGRYVYGGAVDAAAALPPHSAITKCEVRLTGLGSPASENFSMGLSGGLLRRPFNIFRVNYLATN